MPIFRIDIHGTNRQFHTSVIYLPHRRLHILKAGHNRNISREDLIRCLRKIKIQIHKQTITQPSRFKTGIPGFCRFPT